MPAIPVDKTGIPTKSNYPGGMSVPALYTMFQGVFMSVGGAIAYAVYTYGNTAKYDAKMVVVKGLDLGWLYAGLLAFKVGGIVLQMMLGVARKESKVAPPDQHVYQGYGESKYTLMVQEGAHGRFNRAQRAWCNYLEQQPYFLAMFVLNGFVYPFETFCMACGWLASRSIGALGYIKSADDRMGGNLLGMVISSTMECMIALTAFRTLAPVQ
eukprot:CAMPEP_0206241808 /NCGR_PEP_ID=MMETSP0047_2-20121206/16704_1 /ASSEMBLY_ACC=CAM_ASM_000192 /TAXON_ID=195065 /ORGANISM="Chroomonas mesostigmatica_cf, Strain CCMP1168" /LENGTH=211 /DNA_ID=CAMNT_0053666751 /DNA_START=27 /DNA_END=662 /DNA_ORIENTATION=+